MYTRIRARELSQAGAREIEIETEIEYIRNYVTISTDTTRTTSFRAVAACTMTL